MEDQLGKSGLLRPALFVLGGMFIIGLIDNFVAEIAQHAGLWQFHFTRAAIAIPIIIVIARLKGINIWPKHLGAVVVRSAMMTIAMLFYFGALPLLPISAVVAGLFTAPGFVLIFSVAFFGVTVGKVRIASVAIGFIGALMVLDPDLSALSFLLVMPLLAGLFYALNVLCIRYYCADEDTLTLLVWFFGGLGVSGLIGMLLLPSNGANFVAQGWVAPSWLFLGWCLMQAVGSILAVGLLTRAYQICEPTYLSIFEYSLLVFASFWAWILFAQSITAQGAVGIVLIVLSGTVIALRSNQN